nr:CHRD domain-containing protein [uncultured Lacibacter sp.]
MKKNYQSPVWRLRFLFVLLISCSFFKAKADLFPFSAVYSGANEVPANASTATGTIVGVYNDATNTIYYNIVFNGLSANSTAAHFHAPAAPGANAGVTLGHAGFPAGVTAGNYTKIDVFTDAQETNLKAGLMYSNIHTSALPGGEIRAQIILGAASTEIYTFNRTYSGTNEVPPNASTATGTIMGAYNAAANTIFYAIQFSGLSANTTAAHFHAPAIPGTNAGVTLGHAGFPTAVTSGNYNKTDVFTAAQETNLLAGMMYSNIHTTALPGGEIRAQLFFDAPFVAPVITCPANIITSNDPGACSASVSFAASATGTPAAAIIYRTGTGTITSPHVFPVGTTTVTATAINGGGFSTCTFTVTVNDMEAPVISNVSVDPATLWPANHKMRDVKVSYSSIDNCPGTVTCVLAVTSNEDVNAAGDGNTGADWEVVNNQWVKLRAERSGTGTGRIYTILIRCTDAAGNTAVATTTVKVPHDMSAKAKTANSLPVSVLNNPTRNFFTLAVEPGNNNEAVFVRLFDMTGKMVEATNSASQVIRVGNTVGAGIYIAEIRRGEKTTQLKLIKLE